MRRDCGTLGRCSSSTSWVDRGVPVVDAIGQQPARMFLCAACRAQVVVCRDCDQGQRYCAGDCSERTRQRLQREAGRRYQRSKKGRHKQAQRTRRWRARRDASANKVTHQGSLEPGGNDVLAASQTSAPICTSSPTVSLQIPIAALAVAALAPCRCHFCGAAMPIQLRRDFLRPYHHYHRLRVPES